MLCYVTLCYVFEPTSRPEDEADDPKKKVPKKTRSCWRREKMMVGFNMVLPQGLWNYDGGRMNFFNMEKWWWEPWKIVDLPQDLWSQLLGNAWDFQQFWVCPFVPGYTLYP